MEEIYNKLNEIFQDVFDDSSLFLTESTSAEDIEEWDSLAQINLIVAVEEAYGIKFTIDEAAGLHSVGEFAELISQKLEGSSI